MQTHVTAGSDSGPEIIDESTLRETLLPASARSLRNWRDKGILPYIRLPGSRRIFYHRKSVLDALVRLQKGGV